MKEINEKVMPLLEYRFEKYSVFSRFRFMGMMMLDTILHTKENRDLMDQEVKIYEVNISTLQTQELYLNLRNATVEATDHKGTYAIFRIPYKDKKFINQVVKVVLGRKKNTFKKMHIFYASGIKLMLRIQRMGRAPEAEEVLLDGTPWVDHLSAIGMPKETAILLVGEMCKEMSVHINNK